MEDKTKEYGAYVGFKFWLALKREQIRTEWEKFATFIKFNRDKAIYNIITLPVWNFLKVFKVDLSTKRDLAYKNVILYRLDDKQHKSIIDTFLTSSIKYHKTGVTTKYSDKLNRICILAWFSAFKEFVKMDRFVGIQPLTGPVGLVYLMQYMQINENDDNRLSLTIVQRATEAATRKMQAKFSFELLEDMAQIHGISIVKEVVYALSSELLYELVEDVLQTLRKTTDTHSEVQLSDFEFSTEFANQVITTVNKSAIDIARKTRRGVGNFIITSPIIASIMQQSTLFTPPKEKYNVGNALTFVGSVNLIDVYVTLMSSVNSNDIIIGYSGKSSVDKGLVYAPYMFGTSVRADEFTFEPVLMTYFRRAVAENTSDFAPASSYYANVKLLGIDDNNLSTNNDNTDAEANSEELADSYESTEV
jgi:hypothetical protein